MSEAVKMIADAWAERTRISQQRSGDAPSGRSYVYASGYHPCLRKMVLDLLDPGAQGDHDQDSLERFDRGQSIEQLIVAKLNLAGVSGGFTVQEQQKRYELKDASGRVVIVGKTDGVIRFDSGRRVVFDVKSGASVLHCETVDDLLRGRWTRGMIRQVLSYAEGEGTTEGLLILDKPSGPTWVPVDMHEHRRVFDDFLVQAAAAVDRAERIRDDEDVPLPPFIMDQTECLKCDHFRKGCAPDLDFGEGFKLISDETILQLARDREENREAGKVFNRADKALKKKLKGVELGSIAGEFDIVGKWQKSTKTIVPAACPKCEAPIVGKKETNEKGRFLLTIAPAGKEG